MGFDLHGLKPATPEPVWNGPEEFIQTSKGHFKLNPDLDKIKYAVHCQDHEKWVENTKGAYFRNNIWWWRPLWEVVCNICCDILTKRDILAGNYNDGHKISEDKAIAMADRLSKHLDNGFIQEYSDDRAKEMQNKELVDCNICDASGWRKRPSDTGRGDTVLLKEWAFKQQIDINVLKEENIPQAIDCIPCNSCDGSGKKKDFETHYRLNADNVKEFAEFCKHSGGFSIC